MNFLFDTWDKVYQFWKDGWFWIFEQLLTGFVFVLELIPVPSYMTNATSLTLPEGVVYFIHVFELPFGAGIMASAWSLRFVIRRLPVVG